MRKKRKLNLPLIEVVIVSLVVHVAGLIILGGLTIWSAMAPEDPEMEAPAVTPPPPERQQQKVRLEKSQKSSARPKARIAVTNISQINLPDLDVNMPVVESKVSVGTGSVGGGRRGFGTGGIDFAKSDVDFFGIKDDGENVAFILDTAKSMVEVKRGDVAGYAIVIAEITRMINGLKPGTLFNIYAFDDNLEVFRPRPVAANAENRAAAGRWVERFWQYKNGRFTYRGATGFDHIPDMTGLPIRRNKIVIESGVGRDDPDTIWALEDLPADRQKIGEGSSRMDLALLAAAEGGADLIFMITDGTPMVRKAVDDRDLKDYQRRYTDYWRKAKGDPSFEKWLKEMDEVRQKMRDYQADRKRRGLPPEIVERGWVGGFERPKPPKDLGWPPIFLHLMSVEAISDMIGDRVKEIYRREHKRQLPPLHVVGYSTTEKEEEIMDEIQKPFRGGQFRVIDKDDLEDLGEDQGGQS